MSIRSQAELESQYLKCKAQVQSGTLSPEQAFGKMEEWVVQLGQRKALLHPGLKQWLWHVKVNDEWTTAGCGIGEAILLTIGNVGGLKKLTQPGEVSEWCVYRQGQELFGPLRIGELVSKLRSQPDLKDILVWSPQATSWLSVAFDAGGAISFHDEAGNLVAIKVTGETASPPTMVAAPVPAAPAQKSVPAPAVEKKSKRNLIIAIVAIVVILCFCLPALLGILYYVAKDTGVLPAWLGGTSWVPLILMQI
jgi:hypothetical protein